LNTELAIQEIENQIKEAKKNEKEILEKCTSLDKENHEKAEYLHHLQDHAKEIEKIVNRLKVEITELQERITIISEQFKKEKKKLEASLAKSKGKGGKKTTIKDRRSLPKMSVAKQKRSIHQGEKEPRSCNPCTLI